MEGGGSPTVRVVGDHELIGYVKDPYVGLLTDKVDVAVMTQLASMAVCPSSGPSAHPR